MRFILYLFFAVFIMSCNSRDEVIIDVCLKDYKESTPIFYGACINRATVEQPDTIFADREGKFTITLPINDTRMFCLGGFQDGKMFYSNILVKPGEKHSINCQLVKDPSDQTSVIVKGSNCAGQTLLASVDNGQRGWNPTKSNWNLINSSTIIDSLTCKIERTILPFTELYDKDLIDSVFYNYSKNYINYYFAYQIQEAIAESLRDKKNRYNNDLEQIRENIFNTFNVNDNNIINTSVFLEYVYLYVDYLNDTNKNEYEIYSRKGLSQTYSLNKMKDVLTDEGYKYFALNYIWGFSSGMYKETVDLFKKYKLEYPNYNSHPHFESLSKNIDLIVKFYQKENTSNDIVYNDRSITSFDDITSRFKGKPILIDCWATWCPGCISQFRHNSALKEYLKKKDIELVYIAFEKHSNIERWKKYTENYNLSGYHIMRNDSLQNSLYEKLGIMNSRFELPRYILVDNSGEIVIKNALYPSTGKKLIEQIENKLN